MTLTNFVNVLSRGTFKGIQAESMVIVSYQIGCEPRGRGGAQEPKCGRNAQEYFRADR
jgi:hypothetical protein